MAAWAYRMTREHMGGGAEIGTCREGPMELREIPPTINYTRPAGKKVRECSPIGRLWPKGKKLSIIIILWEGMYLWLTCTTQLPLNIHGEQLQDSRGLSRKSRRNPGKNTENGLPIVLGSPHGTAPKRGKRRRSNTLHGSDGMGTSN